AFVAGGAFPAWAKTVFRLSNQLPPSHHISKGLDIFAAKVSEYSKGEMELKVFHSAQLFKDTEVVEALQNELMEMGIIPINKWSGMIPATDIFEVPFIFNELPSIKNFIEAGADEILDKEFRKKQVKTVFWVDYGYVQFFNNKHPITKPQDFAGLKMRTFSSGDSETLQALGASPTVMSSSEMYMAMQRGTVDGGTTGMPAAVSRKLMEVQKFMTMANYATPEFIVQANLDWWKKLTEGEKEVILKAGKVAEESIRQSVAESEAKAEKTLAENGVRIYRLTAADRQVFIAATNPVQQVYLNNTGDIGNKLLTLAKELLAREVK
ncbi:MAG: TRAP transporter substrate-binding protein DctP, partial [Pseudomonadota bacterium]